MIINHLCLSGPYSAEVCPLMVPVQSSQTRIQHFSDLSYTGQNVTSRPLSLFGFAIFLSLPPALSVRHNAAHSQRCVNMRRRAQCEQTLLSSFPKTVYPHATVVLCSSSSKANKPTAVRLSKVCSNKTSVSQVNAQLNIFNLISQKYLCNVKLDEGSGNLKSGVCLHLKLKTHIYILNRFNCGTQHF